MLGQGLKYNTSRKPILSSSDILVPLPHDELLKQQRGFCAKHFQPPPSRAGFGQLLLTAAWLWSRGGTLEALPVCRRHRALLAVPHREHLPSSQRSGAALTGGEHPQEMDKPPGSMLAGRRALRARALSSTGKCGLQPWPVGISDPCIPCCAGYLFEPHQEAAAERILAGIHFVLCFAAPKLKPK